MVGEQGFAQMLGKIGLTTIFFVMGGVSGAGAILTLFLPDSRSIDLAEEDRRFVTGWLGEDKAARFFEESKRNMDEIDALEVSMTASV